MAIMDVLQDEPVIRTSFVNVDALYPPNVIFKAAYNFTLNCVEVRLTLESYASVNCAPDITQPDEYGPFYYGFYQPSQDVAFLKIDDNNTLLTSILLDINFGDNFPPIIDIIAIDSDYDPITESIKENSFDDPFNFTVIGMNAYGLGANQFYLLKYSRIIKESIIPSWKNDFGITPNYETKSNIISNLSFFIQPMGAGVVSVQVDKEIRTHTYLGSLGLIGGAWGLVVAMYSLLFGADKLRPWGITQLYCCGVSRLTRNKLKKTLPIIPFFETSYLDVDNHLLKNDLSLAEQNKLRIDSLEIFLQEYVVDWGALSINQIKTIYGTI
ncbi:hypothetical protein C1645_831537 [Glomus cerebriforme]|uniref:Uncharacterized protein n=1 Tax=Glomus cerebriforme TaxID=658196 RepID=A0A397SQ40_9GLOM|nr:hypothetical protein C1645_831537 [Glomus cerebriforme]